MKIQSHSLLGMRLDYVTPQQGVQMITDWAVQKKPGYCCVPNVHMCIETIDNPDFRKLVNEAVLNWSDSTILQKARSLRFGIDMLPVMKGADMMPALLQAAVEKNLTVGLYGASEETIQKLRQKLPQRFPDLKLAYAFSPPFRPLSKEEDAQIVEQINGAGIDLLLVGLGCPKQERWMAEHTDRLPHTMMIGIGAAFDFNAGTVAPSPSWVHQYGVEWLYRMIHEPKRLARRYLSTSPRFLMLLLIDALKCRIGRKNINS